jgi:hypothetical protein
MTETQDTVPTARKGRTRRTAAPKDTAAPARTRRAAGTRGRSRAKAGGEAPTVPGAVSATPAESCEPATDTPAAATASEHASADESREAPTVSVAPGQDVGSGSSGEDTGTVDGVVPESTAEPTAAAEPTTAPNDGGAEATPGDPPHAAPGDDAPADPHVAQAIEELVRTTQQPSAETGHSVATPRGGTVIRHTPGAGKAGAVKYSDRILAAAEARFADDPDKDPLTREQLERILTLLHREDCDRSLRSSTYAYLERGMHSRHAAVVISRLDGTFGAWATREPIPLPA